MSDKEIPLREGYQPQKGYHPEKPSEPTSPEPHTGYQPIGSGDSPSNEPSPPTEE